MSGSTGVALGRAVFSGLVIGGYAQWVFDVTAREIRRRVIP